MRGVKFAVASAALLAVSLVGIEVALQVASRLSLEVRRALAAPWERSVVAVPDERLVYRGNPLTPGHDRHGFRNEDRPEAVDIVAFGDSQTYGFTAPRDAWPRILASLTGRGVYNMAIPGYGPGQALLMLPEALALGPRRLVLAPYLGNDLFDCFVLARRHPELREGVSPSLWAEAEARDRAQRIEDELPSPFQVSKGEEIAGPRRWLSQHIQLYRLARAVYHVLRPPPPDALLSRDFATAAAALTPEQLPYTSLFDDQAWRTILTSPYRGRPLDDGDPRLRAGFEILRWSILRIAERGRASGARTLVVFLPTKESVFWTRVRDPDAHPGLQPLVTDEDRLRRELTADFEAHGIEVLDLLPALRAAPEQPYYEDIDSHPNPVGNGVIAEAVAARLGALP